MFTSLTLLTCYQIASSRRRCVRLQCWEEKRAFPVRKALYNVVVVQQFLSNFQTFLEDVRFINMYPPHFLRDSYHSPFEPKMQPHNNQPTKHLREDTCSKAQFYVPRSVAIAAVDRIFVLSNRQPKIDFDRDCAYANEFPSGLKTPMRAC